MCMKKQHISILSFVLALVMVLAVFSSCGKNDATNENGTTQQTKEEQTNQPSEQPTEEKTEKQTEKSTENESEDKTSTETNGETQKPDGTEPGGDVSETAKDTSPKLEGEYAELIENAYHTSNNISAYFTDGDRSGYEITNMNMVYTYNLFSSDGILATLANKNGGVYLDKTMDVFVTMDTGKTYYSSQSNSDARGNSFRYGFYYYDVRLLDHDFVNNIAIVDSQKFDTKSGDLKMHEMGGGVDKKTGAFKGVIKGIVDPQVRWDNISIDTSTFNAISITVKVEQSSQMELFIIAGEKESYSEEQKVRFDLIADSEYHTYIIPLDGEDIEDFTGTLKGLRLDFNGYTGENIEVTEINFVKRDYDGAPALYLDRTLHTYPDKLHQTAHVVAGKDTSGIKEIGMITKISADTVAKIIVKDAKALHETLDGVDWNSAEYIAFDIKGVGIFGYIMPYDNQSGKLKVTLEDGVYTILQTKTPEGGTILAPVSDTSNDFYMGQRLYTDTNHDFVAFLKEAEIERHPLTGDNIVVDTEKSPASSFNGYEALRGAYKFTLPPNVSFQDSYDNRFNEHNNVMFTVTGDTTDRTIYVLAYAFTTDIECSVVLDKNEMLLPISVQSCKNFKHELEEPRFDKGDVRYSEAYFPMVVRAGQSQTLKVIHLYQNWGVNPLKQISSIQCFAPYYHLSTGTTETNCITNQYVYGKDLFTLPDHRSMSAPFWKGQPQHTAGGYHHFLQYTDVNGKYSASENIDNYILAYGPTYAEIDMNYISDDGRIKVTYTHMEMPQTDENRAYYEMKYEVLEDISFDNFAEDFSFYKASAYQGTYQYIGYLDENNQSQIVEVNQTNTPKIYTLGDKCPYFDSFKMISGVYMEDYVNLSCLIYNYDLVIGGEKSDANLALVDVGYGSSLSIDLKEVTLKKGDTITINMLLVPWGSQESIYDGSNGLAPDENVRCVRENTLVNPIVAIPGEKCEAVEDTYVPKVKTTDGKTATFTVSGGKDNVLAGTYNTVVRVYGFDALTVPRIMERVDGKWTEYRVNSALTPDVLGNRHPYDGYAVHYDGDGTYSYSFVVDMTEGKDREFKVIAGGRFTGWTEDDRNPEIEDTIEPSEDLLPIYFDPSEINAGAANGVSDQKVMKDGDTTFIRFIGNGESIEANISMIPVSTEPTGQYIVIRYRIPEDSPIGSSQWYLEVFSSTTSNTPGSTNFAHRPGVIADGEWHLSIFDMTAFETSKEFIADDKGEYHAKFIRLDMFNSQPETPWGTDAYIDIAYVGMSGSLEEIYSINSDIVDSNGNELPDETLVPEPLPLYFDGKDIKDGAYPYVCDKEIVNEDGESFVRIYGNGEQVEARVTLANVFGTATGQYAVVKYRIPTTNQESYDDQRFDIFTSTVNSGPTGNDFAHFGNIQADGNWHIIVADITKFTATNKAFEAVDGVYTAKYVAFDYFNQVTSTESYIDIAYIGMTGDLADVESLVGSLGQYTLINGYDAPDQTVVEVTPNE